jgi:hypothetical protein
MIYQWQKRCHSVGERRFWKFGRKCPFRIFLPRVTTSDLIGAWNTELATLVETEFKNELHHRSQISNPGEVAWKNVLGQKIAPKVTPQNTPSNQSKQQA